MKRTKSRRKTTLWTIAAALCVWSLMSFVLLMDTHPTETRIGCESLAAREMPVYTETQEYSQALKQRFAKLSALTLSMRRKWQTQDTLPQTDAPLYAFIQEHQLNQDSTYAGYAWYARAGSWVYTNLQEIPEDVAQYFKQTYDFVLYQQDDTYHYQYQGKDMFSSLLPDSGDKLPVDCDSQGVTRFYYDESLQLQYEDAQAVWSDPSIMEGISIYLAPLPETIAAGQEKLDQTVQLGYLWIIGAVASGFAAVLFTLIVIAKAARKPEEQEAKCSVLDSFSLESICILLLCILPAAWVACRAPDILMKAALFRQHPLAQCNGALYVGLIYLLSLGSLASLIRRIGGKQLAATSLIRNKLFSPKQREQRRQKREALHKRLNAPVLTVETARVTSWLNRHIQRLRQRWSKLSFLQQTAVHSLIALFAILLLVLYLFPFEDQIMVIFLLTSSLLVMEVYGGIQLHRARQIDELSQRIRTISQGDFSPVPPAGYSCVEQQHRELDQIMISAREAAARQIQAERTKINLVTNVSHDLKTPLTSLISYIDLLSKEKLPPQAMDYVRVLERKSERLSRMVQDVFDLAKAASGEDVHCIQLDAVMCLRQVLADMADTIRHSGRELRIQNDQDSCIILAEGSKLYRIYQNLLCNALRYSMENTRIFIHTTGSRTEFCCRIQNTASYEMHFTPEEITERFTRGDAMRSTEGSGLGLAIAKSFAEACGGSFRVEIDGDQFKTVLTFPCCDTDPAEEA